jgi:hypothetical protein
MRDKSSLPRLATILQLRTVSNVMSFGRILFMRTDIAGKARSYNFCLSTFVPVVFFVP